MAKQKSPQRVKRVVAIAGNMGVGKTELARLLAQELSWDAFFEEVADNPYIADFYKDMRTWSFHSQVFYLGRRLKSYARARYHPRSLILDRSVYEDAEIFAKNLYLQGKMSERDWKTYCDLYEAQLALLPKPDLLVYLRASVPTLLGRIKKRGRDYEREIERAYLEQLNGLYEEWIQNFALCLVLTIEADDLDFVKNPDHLRKIALEISKKLL